MTKMISMTRGRPLKLLFFFALPLMGGNIFQQLYTVIDIAIIGRGVGMDALAALGCVDWLNWTMLGIAQGFTQGFSVRVAQKYGADEPEQMKLFIGQSALLSGILAILYLAVGQLTLSPLLALMHAPADLRPMAELYTRILFLGAPSVMFFNYCSAVLRAVGDSRTPLAAMITSCVTNIILDFIAVFVLGWGIGGAAAATVFAQTLSGLVCAVKIKQTPLLHFGKAHLRKHTKILKNLMQIGSPAAAKNIIIAVGGMTVQAIVNRFGTGFIAGFTATNKLYGLLEIAAISYGYAITTYVGQNYGAGKTERIREGMRASVFLAVMTSLVISALMFLFGRQITSLFISSEVPELVAEAKHIAYLYLCTMATFLPILYLLHVYLSALQGMGDTVHPMISGIIELLMRVCIALVIGHTGYETGIFSSEIFAWTGAALYLIYHYHKKISVLRTKQNPEG